MSTIEKYFNGEILQCSIGVAISLISIGMGIYFLFWLRQPYYKGIAYPFIVISLLLTVVCTTVILKSSKDAQRITESIASNEYKKIHDEYLRMQKVLKSFRTLKIVELIIVAICAILLMLFSNVPLVKGIATGLIIQAVMLYAFDYIAMERGKVYYYYLVNVLGK
jgi:hypothetical protein